MAEPWHGDIQRGLGRVEGKLEQVLESRRERDEHVDGRLERIEARIEAAVARIESIVEMLAAIKGGWKTLTAIGAAAGLFGGWIVPAFLKRMMGWP